MSLQDEIFKRIKQEIDTDPMGLGYAGKTDAEIMDILNNPVQKQKVIIETSQSPINRIMSGLADAKNVISTQEVSSAKLVVADVIPDVVP